MATKSINSLLATVFLSACAHSTSPSLSGTAKDTADMSTTRSDQANAQLSAEEVGRRFLELIRMAGSEEISLKQAESVIGISLLPADGGEYYGVGQKLLDGWSYGFLYYPSAHGRRSRVRLVFENEKGRDHEMSAICSLSFVDYHNSLKGMGYTDYPKYGEIGDLIEWMYRKDDLVISIIPEVKYVESEKRVAPTCVRSIGTLN